jgi:hypothetical protein
MLILLALAPSLHSATASITMRYIESLERQKQQQQRILGQANATCHTTTCAQAMHNNANTIAWWLWRRSLCCYHQGLRSSDEGCDAGVQVL